MPARRSPRRTVPDSRGTTPSARLLLLLRQRTSLALAYALRSAPRLRDGRGGEETRRSGRCQLGRRSWSRGTLPAALAHTSRPSPSEIAAMAYAHDLTCWEPSGFGVDCAAQQKL
eukprot:364195-Chlamydomonas_euryale.AAC.13